MSQDFQVGSAVAIVQYKIVESAVIERETNCYWILSNGCKFKKNEAGYSERKRGYCHVELWTDEHDLKLQAQKVEREKIAALSNAKCSLHNYLNHMRIGYFLELNHSQIFALEKACQDILGDVPKR